jgi:hypothetical protein
MITPQLVESFILTVAVGWCLFLHRRRQAGRVTLFMAVYLGLPAAGLFCQAMGYTALINSANWTVVLGNAIITALFIRSTYHAESDVLHGMVLAENRMIAREARVRAYTLATIVLRNLPPEPTGTSKVLHAALG